MVDGICRLHQQTNPTPADIKTGKQVRNLIVETTRMVFEILMEAVVGKENDLAF